MAPSSSKYFSLYFTQNSIIVFTFIINSITSWSFWILRPSLWNWICYFRGKKSSIEAVHTTLVIDDENPTRLNTVQLLPTLWTKPAEFFRVKKKLQHQTINFNLDFCEDDWAIVGLYNYLRTFLFFFFIYCNWYLCSLKIHVHVLTIYFLGQFYSIHYYTCK